MKQVDRRKIELEDFLQYRFLSALSSSPSGKTAAYVVSRCSEDREGYESCIWIHDVATRENRQLTAFGRERSYLWEDETTLLFPALRSDRDRKRKESGLPHTVFYRIGIHGGEAVRAFEVALDCSVKAKLADGRYVLVADTYVNRPLLVGASPEQREAYVNMLAEEADYEVFDELPFWYNGRGVTNKRRERLFLYDPASGEAKAVTDPLFEVADVDVDPERGIILYSGHHKLHYDKEMLGLYYYYIDGDRTVEAVPQMTMTIRRLALWNGRALIAGADEKDYGVEQNADFYFADPDGTVTLLAAPDRSPHSSMGSDSRYGGGYGGGRVVGDRFYFQSTLNSCSQLMALEQGGDIRTLSRSSGSVDGFAITAEGPLVVAMHEMRLQELYCVGADGSLTQVSAFNEHIEATRHIQPAKPLHFTNSDGVLIEGFVIYPVGYEPGRKYPGLLEVHGGPKTAFGEVFFHEMQLFASDGYFVFYCNPRGSDGRGNEFADIRYDFGGKDYRDLMEFCDFVLEQIPDIDPQRTAVAGGSYGGFMTNWIIGHTDRFCAAVSQRSISNWMTDASLTDNGHYFAYDQHGGTIWEGLDKLWAQSPLKYADQCKTPTLFIHAEQDYRCTMAEGLQMFSALVRHQCEARLCLFHGENHELSRAGKPRHRVRRLQEIKGWIDRFCKQ
ncbi:MAG: S9 family peptidase [Clostridiales bacterium]|nr:S9 family peptidase [Clostridiales bacterium]